ncbi:MAG TPA: carbamoyltransferase N-terminal domain-containing protein, partial [Rubrivivax sp.]|nr:carbamoyltransferase N-terminal domain-containing protein [Rubrivivax sp.]
MSTDTTRDTHNAGQPAKTVKTVTLGINAAYHDSSAAVVVDGVLVAAAEEERFSRIKHAKR